MDKGSFISAVAEKSGCTKKDADAIVKAFVEVISDVVKKDDSIMIPGLGTFSVVEKSERTVRNPRTGETSTLPAHKAPKFKFATAIKNAAKEN